MIVSLADAAQLESDLLGAKGASLARMAAQSLPVPRGYVVTTEEFDEFRRTGFVSERVEQLGRMVRGDRATRWACRSSATVEDSHSASYAGRFRTYLNIQSAELSRHVGLCWKSAISQEVESYRRQMQDKRNVRMAVVVQEMVPALVSGVAFVSDNEVILEGSWGLGEAIVGGLAEPDRWVFRSSPLALKGRHIGQKQVRLFSPPSRRKRYLFGNPFRHPAFGSDYGTVVQVTDHLIACIPANLQLAASAPCLSSDKVEVLAELCQRVATGTGGPQDIEWAWDGRQFYILQSRPITHMVSATPCQVEVHTSVHSLRGLGVSAGTMEGPPRAVWSEEDLAGVREGDVLIAFQTQPSYIEALTKCGGVVTETGGLLSHAAIVCRELGKPCVVGVSDARKALAEATSVAIDGLAGTVSILESGHHSAPVGPPADSLPFQDTLPVIGDKLPWRV